MDRRRRKSRGAGSRSQDERTHRSSLIQEDSFEAEVPGLHAFFERWYSGAADPNEITRLDVLAGSFVMSGPDGGSNNVGEVRSFAEAAHGCRPTEFRIRNVVILPDAPVGTYEERQTADGVTIGRLSPAVMTLEPGTPNGLRWLHLHEAWLPDARPQRWFRSMSCAGMRSSAI